MADGLSIDTSSYPKPQPVAPTNPLDTMGKVIDIQRGQQQLQSGGLTIDKQKLDLVNDRFNTMAKDFTALMSRPDLNEDQIRKRIQTDVKLGIVTPEMAGTFITQLPPTQGMKPNEAASTLKDHLGTWLNHAQTIKEAIDTQFGNQATQENSSEKFQGVQQSPINGGGFVPSTRMPIQVPPTQPTVNTQRQLPNGEPNPNYLRPGVVGSSVPSGVYPAQPQNNLPVSSPAVSMPQSRPRGLPVAPAVSGPTGPTINRDTVFNDRFNAAFPNSVPTGAAPGEAEAIQSVAGQSGKDYASALTRSKNLQADLYPANRVLDILHQEGPNAFGVGTDNLNTLKNAMVTWFPNTDPKTVQSVSNFEEAKKQLVQLARSNGNSGTNDQLAAAFEGSPNTKMTGATIGSVVKSIVALRKMEAAQTLMFGQTGLPESQYSKWVAKNQNQFDPRAFGFDIMDRDKQDKLLSSMTEKDGDSVEMKAAKAKAYTKFKNSLQFAHDSDLIGNQ